MQEDRSLMYKISLFDVPNDLENLQMQYLNANSTTDETELSKTEQEILYMRLYFVLMI